MRSSLLRRVCVVGVKCAPHRELLLAAQSGLDMLGTEATKSTEEYWNINIRNPIHITNITDSEIRMDDENRGVSRFLEII